jgi:hypothetical protein
MGGQSRRQAEANAERAANDAEAKGAAHPTRVMPTPPAAATPRGAGAAPTRQVNPVASATSAELERLAVAALAMLNRVSRYVAEEDLDSDLSALLVTHDGPPGDRAQPTGARRLVGRFLAAADPLEPSGPELTSATAVRHRLAAYSDGRDPRAASRFRGQTIDAER